MREARLIKAQPDDAGATPVLRHKVARFDAISGVGDVDLRRPGNESTCSAGDFQTGVGCSAD